MSAVLAAVALAASAAQIGAAALRLDERGMAMLMLRFEPALAPGLFAAFGPTRAVYATLAGGAIAGALIAKWRAAPAAILAALASPALALALGTLLSVVVARPGPLVFHPDAPVPANWRAPWQAGGSLPSVHALVCAALAHTAARTWAPLAFSAYPIALAAAASAIFFGEAWASDVVVAFLLGVLVAESTRWLAGRLANRRVTIPKSSKLTN